MCREYPTRPTARLISRYALVGQCGRLDALSAVEHRPADVVPQPLVVEYELANRLGELFALPSALESSCALALSFRRGSTYSLDRIGGRTELVRGDVCDGRGLACSVRGMPCCPTQVSGRAHGMAGRRASLGHRDLAAHPGAGLLDRLTRSRVLRLSRLEEIKDVPCARCRPQGEKLVIRIGEGPTTTDRHETRIAVFREDHSQPPSAHICPTNSRWRAATESPPTSCNPARVHPTAVMPQWARIVTNASGGCSRTSTGVPAATSPSSTSSAPSAGTKRLVNGT